MSESIGLLQTLARFCFGRACLVCHRSTLLAPGDSNICRPCLADLPWRLSDCALPWPKDLVDDLPPAMRTGFQDSCILVACRYEPPVRDGLLALKFHDASEWSQTFAALAAMLLHRRSERFDALAAVPLHADRLAERGYNQAGLIAAQLARCLDLPDWSAQLIRHRATARQSEQTSREARRHNLADAFCWTGAPDLRPARILLVDDVLTTGTTLLAAAVPLAQCGARVTGLAIASNQTASAASS